MQYYFHFQWQNIKEISIKNNIKFINQENIEEVNILWIYSVDDILKWNEFINY
jgi:hypothetical protein